MRSSLGNRPLRRLVRSLAESRSGTESFSDATQGPRIRTHGIHDAFTTRFVSLDASNELSTVTEEIGACFESSTVSGLEQDHGGCSRGNESTMVIKREQFSS